MRPPWIARLTNEQLRYHIGEAAIERAQALAALQAKDEELAALMAEASARAGAREVRQ